MMSGYATNLYVHIKHEVSDMRILLDNVNINANNGPNSFGRQLTSGLTALGHDVMNTFDLMHMKHGTPQMSSVGRPDAQVSFIENLIKIPNVPLIQRLDGIYYNSDSRYGDWWIQNAKIKDTYDIASGVIFQTSFSRRLVETFFGTKSDVETVEIHNGVDMSAIVSIHVDADSRWDSYDEIWMCASNWRPHKRLIENIRYFEEHAPKSACLLIAGTVDAVSHSTSNRIFYLGDISWSRLISLYKRASHFVHLAYHDNCANVVIDARACGCQIVCASCSGTPTIAGPDATVIDEPDWNPGLIELYKPPRLDFTRARRNGIDSSIDIISVTRKYIDFISRFTIHDS